MKWSYLPASETGKNSSKRVLGVDMLVPRRVGHQLMRLFLSTASKGDPIPTSTRTLVRQGVCRHEVVGSLAGVMSSSCGCDLAALKKNTPKTPKTLSPQRLNLWHDLFFEMILLVSDVSDMLVTPLWVGNIARLTVSNGNKHGASKALAYHSNMDETHLCILQYLCANRATH